MHSLFISFEGIDGSGKSTQIELLKSSLEKMNYTVLLTREPGETILGKEIRKILLNPKNTEPPSPIAEVFLFMADRNQHVEKIIKPAMNKYDFVITDRYIDSTLAYQGYGRNINLNNLIQLNNIATDNLKPNLTIVLDVDTSKAEKRINNGPSEFDEIDRMEKEEKLFHDNVRNGYKEIAKKEPDRVKIINGIEPIDKIHKKILNEVTIKLQEKKDV